MRLVPDWKSCWRWFSVQLMAVSAAIQATMMVLPPSLLSFMPESTMKFLALAFVVGAVRSKISLRKCFTLTHIAHFTLRSLSLSGTLFS